MRRGDGAGLGLAPTKIDGVVGIFKAYTTRVGAGPFPTELKNDLGQRIRQMGHEFGTTTGRLRRCGWLDAFAIKYTHVINNFTLLNLTKLDVLSELDEIKIAVSYKYNGGLSACFISIGERPETLILSLFFWVGVGFN